MNDTHKENAMNAKQPNVSRLAAARRSKGLSLRKLGAELGVSRMAVSYWEKGICRPRPNRVVPLAALLGLRPEEIADEGDTEGRQ